MWKNGKTHSKIVRAGRSVGVESKVDQSGQSLCVPTYILVHSWGPKTRILMLFTDGLCNQSLVSSVGQAICIFSFVRNSTMIVSVFDKNDYIFPSGQRE